ncbi:MAG: hypothetical protein ACYC6Y_30320, partial [Thermoguttaceae bacterium]
MDRRRAVAAAVSRMIDRLASEPETDVKDLAGEFGLHRPAPAVEEELLRRLASSKGGEARALLRLLAPWATPRSAPRLVRLAENGELREEVLAIVGQTAGAKGLAELVSRSPDRRVRAAVYGRLLGSGEEASLAIYLELVHTGAATGEALAVAGDLSPAVLEMLLERLEDENEDTRLAAALVL